MTFERFGSMAYGTAALGIAVALCGSVSGSEPLPASPEASAPLVTATVELQLRDGRRVTGELLARTNSGSVWIRAASGSITLDSGFAWERVRGVRHAGQWLNAAECERLITHVKAVSSEARAAAD